jgi:hypothetical protein
MSGLILLFVLGVWFFIAKKLTSFLTTKMQVSTLKKATQVLLFAMILVAPVADEIVGGFQFRALCERGYLPIYDAAKAKGKTVYLKDVPDENISNSLIPIREEYWKYVDSATGETLLSWKEYHAKGGWLSRAVGFPQGSPPYTFNAICSSESNYFILKRLNITLVKREKNHE